MEDVRGEVVDLLVIVDATSSMHSYLESLRQSLPQIISISVLTNCFDRIGLVAYRDYCDRDLLEWSGWMTFDGTEEQPNLVEIASCLVAKGGGDYPEATKTGLAKAYEVMRPEAKTLVLLYADAPPHVKAEEDNGYSNASLEQKALGSGSFSGYGPLFADWVSASHALRDGEKKAQVISILSGSMATQWGSEGYYEYLSSMTNGACAHLLNDNARNISEVTIEILLAWMGVKKDGVADVSLPGNFAYYQHEDVGDIASFQDEDDPRAVKYFKNQSGRRQAVYGYEQIGTATLENRLAKKESPLQDFSKTYKSSAKYRTVVTAQLRKIIQQDVAAISLNPVFGSLWRTFCNDRENDHRQEMLDLFGREIESMRNAESRAKLKMWLEESYDYTGEVLEAIAKVPEALRFPCVCLDPTLAFTQEDGADDEGDDTDNRAITDFRRDELLEIGRSCDWRILRRLGRVLTRLTFVDSADALPTHIASAGDAEVTRIPMALASSEYGRKFWRILLHIVVPGTMLSGRPAALLAALAMRLGVQPLWSTAETEVTLWQNRWNDLEIPETWNVNSLSLLLDADLAHRKKRVGVETLTITGQETGLLLQRDRELFARLVDYRMLELNLNTILRARVAWTPLKTLMPIGPLVNCKQCQFPRSVTVMGPSGVCGICCFRIDNNQPEAERSDAHPGVSKDDGEETEAYWFECSIHACRTQYIVYNVEGLNVRPKCHYCRNQQQAPFVECVKCLCRMIWPLEYRADIDTANFTCIGCRSGRQTEIEVETTATKLREENGETWLLKNENNKIKQPFNNRTLYHTASNAAPLDNFCKRVHVLPAKGTQDLDLHLSGRLVRNSHALVKELYSWVSRRRTEAGTCSLCFSNIRKTDLVPACGRSGCHQRTCKGCLESWYGLNAAGRIINTAALHCPFCRRAPTAKTLAKYSKGTHAVGSLRDAMEQHGEWIYAWCCDCGHAKQYMERVCANGAPPELQHFSCEDCHALKSAKDVKTKPCPGCRVETQKTGGCDHIRCPCGQHWCFHCGEKQEEDRIYEHMDAEHGGYYGGVPYEDEDEDEDDYDENLQGIID